MDFKLNEMHFWNCCSLFGSCIVQRYTVEIELMGHLVNSKATKQAGISPQQERSRKTRMKTPLYTQFYEW